MAPRAGGRKDTRRQPFTCTGLRGLIGVSRRHERLAQGLYMGNSAQFTARPVIGQSVYEKLAQQLKSLPLERLIFCTQHASSLHKQESEKTSCTILVERINRIRLGLGARRQCRCDIHTASSQMAWSTSMSNVTSLLKQVQEPAARTPLWVNSLDQNSVHLD